MFTSRPFLARPHRPLLSLGVALAASTTLVLSRMSSAKPSTHSPSNSTIQYTPRHTTWPYRPSDFTRQDATPDTIFYQPSRLVTHIDSPAISALESYYATSLPLTGSILDFCSSWTSHLPPPVRAAIASGALRVTGAGMNQAELAANPLLADRIVHDLNLDPTVPEGPFDAATCVVSIDYLTRPVEVLRSLRTQVKPGGTVHLVVSNRCFPTKVIARWLRVDEDERLQMVGDFLHFAGWQGIEILDLKAEGDTTNHQGLMSMFGAREDPLWVVRGRNGEVA